MRATAAPSPLGTSFQSLYEAVSAPALGTAPRGRSVRLVLELNALCAPSSPAPSATSSSSISGLAA